MCLQNVECPIDPFVDEDHEWCECHDCCAPIYMGKYSDFVDAEYWPEKKDNTWVCHLCIKDVKYSEKILKDRYTQEWIIQKEMIDTYFNESMCRNEFRVKVYTDSNFINWCKEYSKENNINLRRNKYSKSHPVIACGDSWWNWKVGNKSDTGCRDPEKHKFLNPSFHYIKQIYDSEAQPKGKNKKFIN